METLCGQNCGVCGFRAKCKGCAATGGNPFGGHCIAAEYIRVGGKAEFERFKETLMDEINSLGIDGMPKVTELFSLCGFYVNLAYPMPSGECVKLLCDNRVYLGAQVPCLFDGGEGTRCFGIVADRDFILVCTYAVDGAAPEIVLYKQR